MQSTPETRPSLLVRVRDRSDAEAWRVFVDLYAPLVYGLARKHGLQDADAADLTQDVMRSVASAIGTLEYDARRGSFRGWLYTVARNRLRDFKEHRFRHGQGTGDTAMHELLNQQPVASDPVPDWDREFERRVFTWAAEQIKGDFHDKTWRAFWMMAVDGKSSAETGRELDMKVGAVHVAKSRVLARLKEIVRPLLEE